MKTNRRVRRVPAGARAFLAVTLMYAVACSDGATAPNADASPQFAKGGGKPGGSTPTSYPAVWTMADLGIASDGGGAYRDGACGVTASLNLRTDGQWGSNMDPDAAGGTCVRSATLTLAVRHVSDTPHVDDTSTPLGVFGIGNFGFVLDSGVGKVNPLAGVSVQPCFTTGRNGRTAGVGMRFDPSAYPGSSSLLVSGSVETGYLVSTRPYPDNLAYCDTNGTVDLWHVDMRIDIGRSTP